MTHRLSRHAAQRAPRGLSRWPLSHHGAPASSPASGFFLLIVGTDDPPQGLNLSFVRLGEVHMLSSLTVPSLPSRLPRDLRGAT